MDEKVHRTPGGRSEILRLIRKWLKAGVSENGQWSETKLGTPQGAVASPLLANVYLHYLFDLWADVWRKKMAKGDVIVVRYADDDLVVGFQHRTDAERFLREFRERLAKFGLELHPDKTRLDRVRAVRRSGPEAAGRGKTRDLHLPGFTTTVGDATRAEPSPYGGLLRKKRMVAKLKAIKVEASTPDA